ncbi:ABC transporter ATP-binding protein [Candidatus Bathyarchaeota archaeon]|nr:ABC transporter ATP-binding protein [Candidatus Bathyarchaeota archaeon]
MPIIEARGLTYTYPGGSSPSLRDVSFKVERGEFVLLTGPSGCGKTTLCRCLNGLIPHFYGGTLKGELMVSGLKVTEHPIHELALHVGLVFQNPENQIFALSVEKDVAFGLENLGMEREEMRRRVEWALDVTGIRELRNRAPHELSGGQQQRVAIAGVLAMRPEILVLDEPTSFLDPLSAVRILDMIKKLNEEGLTIILIEHRLDIVSRYVDHVMIMNEGSIVLDGKPREIFQSLYPELLGVGLPKVAKLFNMLRNDGLNFKDVPLTPEEASRIVEEALHDRGR